MRRLAGVLLSLSLALVAWADTPPRYVIDVEKDRYFLDVGKKDGVTVGQRFIVFQKVEKTHPVTKEKITGRIELGVLILTEVSQDLSIARLEKPSESPILAGAMIEPVPVEPPKTAPATTKPVVSTPTTTKEAPRQIAKHTPLKMVDELEPIDIEVVFLDVANQVSLRYRRTGEGKSVETKMKMTDIGRYSAEIDPDWVEPPSIEYQIIYQDSTGATRILPEEGSFKTDVKPRPFSRLMELKSLYGRPSAFTLSGMTVNFGQGQGNYSGTTLDYHHRIFTKLYGIRMGAGLLHGETPDGEATNYTYALAEIELRLARYFSVLPRVTLGVQEDGFSMGGHFFVRVGREVSYNLLLGTSAISNVGGEFLVINLNAPAGKALTLGGEVRVSDLFSESEASNAGPGLIMSVLPQLRISESLGLSGNLGIATRRSDQIGFTGTLKASYFF